MRAFIFGLVVCLMGLPASHAAANWDLYVSADAASGGDGSREKPFLTLVEARDAIRAARKASAIDGAVTVHVQPGVYRLDSTWELTAEDSGTPQSPVVYRNDVVANVPTEQSGEAESRPADTSARVSIRGGLALDPAKFQPVTEESVRARFAPEVRDRVLVYDLAPVMPTAFDEFKVAFHGTPAGPWLYVDGQPMTLARWPNATAPNSGWASFSKVIDTGLPELGAADESRRKARPGSFEFDEERVARWNLADGVWLQGFWTHDWSDEVIKVASYDRARKVITLAAPHHYGIMGGTWGAATRRFYALNALEELDAPGEWYLDRQRKRLYFLPAGELKNVSIVLATLTQPLVKMSSVKHVALQGLAFEYGHGEGLVLRNVEHVRIADCQVANCAGGGISVDGRENVVQGCDLYNLGTKGLSLSGGDRKSLSPAGNLAFNNHIHHYGVFQRTYAPGIGVNGCGQVVRNNCIHDAPHNAVLYGGNEHLFELNEVYRVVMETGDAGAFYTGRDWTSQGNVLRHNYIHDLGGGDASHVNTMGVYLDDCDSGDRIEGNVFYRAGRAIMIGGGRDNPVLNNLVIDCPIGLHIDARGMTWKQWNQPNSEGWNLEEKAEALHYKLPPWSERYPRLAKIMNDSPQEPLYNPVLRNVFVDCTKQVTNLDGNVRKLLDKLEFADNLVVNTTGSSKVATEQNLPGFRTIAGTPDKPVNLGFADAAAQDFTLVKGSRLLQELPGFEPIPFDKIGLLKPRRGSHSPDAKSSPVTPNSRQE
jgi:hypothetical protein